MVESRMDSDDTNSTCTTAIYEEQHKQCRYPFSGDHFRSDADSAAHDYSSGKCAQEEI